MKYFNLVLFNLALLLVMLPAQLLQARVASTATLQDLSAGKVSIQKSCKNYMKQCVLQQHKQTNERFLFFRGHFLHNCLCLQQN